MNTKKHTRLTPYAMLSALLPLIASAVIGCSGGGGAAPDSVNAKKTPVRPEVANLEQGKDIYFKYCHFCHGQKGFGDGPVGIALSPHPANFVEDRKRMAKTDEEMFKSVSEGVHRDIGGEAMSMPRWQEILTDEERWNVLAYIRFLEQEGLKSVAAKQELSPARTGGTDAK